MGGLELIARKLGCRRRESGLASHHRLLEQILDQVTVALRLHLLSVRVRVRVRARARARVRVEGTVRLRRR